MINLPQSPPLFLTRPTKAQTNSKKSLRHEDNFKQTQKEGFLLRAQEIQNQKACTVILQPSTNNKGRIITTPSRQERGEKNKENNGDGNTPFFAKQQNQPHHSHPVTVLKANAKGAAPTHHRVHTQRSFPVEQQMPMFSKLNFQGRSMSITNETQACLTDMAKGPVKATTRIDLSLA